MKKTFVMLLIIASTPLLSFAQERTEIVVQEKNTGWSGYVTNRFWDNWFISIGAGAQVYFGQTDARGKFGKRIAPAFDFSVGKWFMPSLGLRAQASGFRLKGFTHDPNNMYVKGGPNHNGLYKQSWQQFNVHGDILINLSNWIGGYRVDRFYEAVPYIGFGIMHACRAADNNELTVNAGLINKMRLSDAFDLNIEIKGSVFRNKFSGESGGKRANGIVAVTAGFTYKFNQRHFERSVAPVVMAEDIALAATAQQLEETRAALAQQQAYNRDLRAELNEVKNLKREVKVEKEVVVAPRAIFFTINKANITAKDKVNLKYLADQIKQNPNKQYTIVGYADKATGTPEFNMQLSRKRAENVFNVLTKDFGVNPSQLKVEAKGGVSDLFDSNPLNRVTIVE
ncbi:OmpA family protein [uncultured Odoribacter sp.]|uniref:OmpA family protein n=1 Tax=uncultured Odoribacter sp. TaxID=876416 RepID=UPI00261004A9|nr:OmpA family protein [uncultured Odoribacter sp.]